MTRSQMIMALLSIQSRHGAGVSRMSRMHYKKKPNVDNDIVMTVMAVHIHQPCLYICIELLHYLMKRNKATP